MTEIEQKALALAIEAREDDKTRLCPDPTLLFRNWGALCRAIKQHEAFKQEVSDAVEEAFVLVDAHTLHRFIIPKTKPDPLVEVIAQIGWGNGWDDETDYARQLRAALEARGLEIREKSKC